MNDTSKRLYAGSNIVEINFVAHACHSAVRKDYAMTREFIEDVDTEMLGSMFKDIMLNLFTKISDDIE